MVIVQLEQCRVDRLHKVDDVVSFQQRAEQHAAVVQAESGVDLHLRQPGGGYTEVTALGGVAKSRRSSRPNSQGLRAVLAGRTLRAQQARPRRGKSPADPSEGRPRPPCGAPAPYLHTVTHGVTRADDDVVVLASTPASTRPARRFQVRRSYPRTVCRLAGGIWHVHATPPWIECRCHPGCMTMSRRRHLRAEPPPRLAVRR